MAPHLSAIPGERALQRYVLLVVGVWAVIFAATCVMVIWGFTALGPGADDAAMLEFMRAHQGNLLRTVGGVLMSLVSLALPWTISRHLHELRTVGGLRTRYVWAAVLLPVLALVVLGWGLLVVHVLCLVWLLTMRVDRNATLRVEGGSFG